MTEYLTGEDRERFYEHVDPSNSDASAEVLIEHVEQIIAAECEQIKDMGAHIARGMVEQARREERERIASAIEAKYLGPDSGRNPVDGSEPPDVAERSAYDEGLELAARIARNGGES